MARALCALLALVGVLPFATTLIVRSAWARSWAARQTQEILRRQGIVASYAPSIRVWPLGVQLDNLRVASNDGGPPALVSGRVLVRPKLFALLAGKLVIEGIDVDAPRVRVVVKNGKVANLTLPESKSEPQSGPFHAPFESFSITDASVDLDVDATHLEARALDVDVTAEDDPAAGSSFEVVVRAGRTVMQRPAADGAGRDDDALCSVEGRARIEPDAIVIRHLEASGAADLDPAPTAPPSCDLPADDERRVELSLGHVHVKLAKGGPPSIDGHVHARAPIGVAARAVHLPAVRGWVAVDADVRYGPDTLLPDVSGTVEAHGVQLAQFALARDLKSELSVRRNIIESPKTTLAFADGTVTLTDAVVDPLAGKLTKVRLDAEGVEFDALLRTLGVHPHPHVGWELREVHVPNLSGKLAPLAIDGELTAKTYSFGVYDRPAEDRARERTFGFSEAQLATHVAIRADALKFSEVRATLPHSRVEGAFVSIGFHNDLRVDAPRIVADLDDLSPIGPVAMHGKVEASGRVAGTFSRPEVQGDIKSIAGFVVSDVGFGDLSAGHVVVDVETPAVDITGVRARRRESAYEVPTARLVFGGSRGFVVDAQGSSGGFGLRDLLSMFALDDDPRFDGLDAKFATRADVHVALDGPEDRCGGGMIAIDAKAHLTDIGLYGERFARGDADLSMRWYDRQRGITGADIDVRSFVLGKGANGTTGTSGLAGSVLGSASLRRGGAVAANLSIEGLPLSQIDALGGFASQVEGSVSGVAHVIGNLDDFQPGAGFVARAGVDVSGARVRGVAIGDSHLDLGMTHRLTQVKRAVAYTKCKAPIGPAFDKATYLADTASHGEWTVDGDLLGGTVHLRDVVMTRSKTPDIHGRASLRGVDLGLLARMGAGKGDADAASAPSSAVGGQLWGELIVDEMALDAPARSRVRLFLGPTIVSRGGQRLTLKPPRDPIVLGDDTLTMPALEVTLDSAILGSSPGAQDSARDAGFRGGFVLSGGIARVTTDPTLTLEARLLPVDLVVLQRLVPKVDRARGSLTGSVQVTGKLAAPAIVGELHAAADDIEIHGLPTAITEVHFDAHATSSAIAATGSGVFAGGTVSFDATVPVRGLEIGALDSHIAVRSVRLAPEDGVATTFDADLEVTYDAKAQTSGTAALPHLTGEVTIASLGYTRPISLSADLSTLATRAKRTVVDSYDPALDMLTLDLHVRSRAPLVIKNDLVEVQLAIASGSLEVTGTNQRIGLRGDLRTLPGGRFHFQGNEFDVRQGTIHFEDPTRISPNVDVTAVTEYRRYSDTSAGAASSGATGGPAAASTNATRGGALWRITLHAYGDPDNLRVEMTSEPALSQEDIVLLLAVGMTRAELDQLQASSIGASIALNYLGAATGADRAVKQALPIIDDFRFGSGYSTATGKTEPQLTVGKRLTNDIRASVTAGLSEDRELRSNIEWRLNNRLSVQGSYDNINDVSSSALGNLGVDLRWRLEFE